MPSAIPVQEHAISKKTSLAQGEQSMSVGIRTADSHKRATWTMCTCKICARRCVSANILRKHIIQKHMRMREINEYLTTASLTPKWKCRMCPLTFTSGRSLRYHCSYVHGSGDRDGRTEDVLSGVTPLQMSQPDAPQPGPTSGIVRRILCGGNSQSLPGSVTTGPAGFSSSQWSVGRHSKTSQSFQPSLHPLHHEASLLGLFDLL